MKQESLHKKFILYISTTIIFTIILGTIIYSIFDYHNKVEMFKANIHKQIKNIYPFYQTYLWQVDIEDLIKVSKSLLITNQNLCSITILNQNKKVIFKESKKNSYCLNSSKINIQKKVFYKNLFIGELYFSYSEKNINTSIKKVLILNFVLAIIISLLVILIITYILKIFFSKHLTDIVNQLKVIAKGNYNTKFEKSKYKEINEIVSHLNNMLHEIKLREEKNRELTQKLHDLIQNMPGGIIITDINGKLIEINNSFANKLKVEKEKVLLNKIEDFSSNKYNKKIFYEKLKEISNRGYAEFEWEFVDKNGNIFPVLIKGKKLKLGNENLIILGITNIAYIKQLEKELLTKEKLESLAILAGGIAHDFNNILTSISGNMELIKMLIDSGKIENIKNRIEKIFKAIETAKSLTHQLLTFSKGGAPLKKPFFELKELIKDTTLFILTGSSIDVEFDFQENLYPVHIDPEQISQVIQNIVLNSKQAMGDKGKIWIKAVNDNNYVKIYIKDNGPGMPKSVIDKIWTPYYTTKSSGSGLGLSIVYSIIKKHNGDIKVYSKEGEFTEFEISLPAYTETTLQEKDKLNNSKEQIEKFKDLKILVMDDDQNIRNTLKELLEFLGCNVTTVSSGEEALNYYKAEKFDIVLLDLTVKGGMGGKECISNLLKIDKNIKAIVYSGYSDSHVMVNYKNFGFCSFLKKPFTISSLKEAITNCLNQKGA